MKVAPIAKVLKDHTDRINHMICHTEQHFDEQMSKVFFEDLELPQPSFFLGVGSGTHAEQLARIMIEFEKVLEKEQPDLVMVVGDVNSTLACSLTAKKSHFRVAHIEAGLRSFDRTMPEEINRIVTDAISDLLFVSEKSGLANLENEGIDGSTVHFVGNVMIDSLVNLKQKIDRSAILTDLGITPDGYILVTFHRPSNVDNKDDLIKLIDFLNNLSGRKKVIFPVHPRTIKNLNRDGLLSNLNPQVLITGPVGYVDFQALIRNSSMVITDSGGIQEETTFLGIPCLTVRTTTERPVTVDEGTNYLVGTDLAAAYAMAESVLDGQGKKGKIPELWDGKASERIVAVLLDEFTR
jgi:UDP-N-acetylglucosamine 2-epimerase (non-hydrolysing)